MKHTTSRTKKYRYRSAASGLLAQDAGRRMTPARVKNFGRKMLGLTSSEANQFADVYRELRSGRIGPARGELAHYSRAIRKRATRHRRSR